MPIDVLQKHALADYAECGRVATGTGAGTSAKQKTAEGESGEGGTTLQHNSGDKRQEKRRCPECGTQVGPRFGTGRSGDGSQCPGKLDGGAQCQFVFGAGRRKKQRMEIMNRCKTTHEGKLADVRGAFRRSARKVWAILSGVGRVFIVKLLRHFSSSPTGLCCVDCLSSTTSRNTACHRRSAASRNSS
jgi:hypothetical protein